MGQTKHTLSLMALSFGFIITTYAYVLTAIAVDAHYHYETILVHLYCLLAS